ncbi:MAG: glycosyltransferase [Bacteroidetes bacterium]|nr:glycosyltransferase [Bacteroidota bacterium]MCL4815633.1 glycosyltransferase [Flavobacteriales bacterium]NOG94229.1 glycosyltransferase [Bacteroidota bacterium]CAG0956513.1 Poly-beta-1,6-N-acetyl-D-glucosamine synthase [Flavobacteriales bacterium]
MSPFHLDINTKNIFLLLFFVFSFVQLLYYFIFYFRFAFYKKTNSGFWNTPPVSVIVCARNERENLLNNLPLLLAQDYKHFEIIVVNDNSKDDTDDVLKAFCQQYKNIKVVKVPENERFYFSKKLALTLGIKAAQHEILLLTDADCKPFSKNWIRCMTENMVDKKEIVLGYSAYEKKEGFLNLLIRFDTFNTAVNYISFALAGMPYMGVGRNLSYKKSLFFKHKGFASHQHIQSGDDDLFVNEVANKHNTTICIHSDGFTLSQPKHTWSEWFFQKKRHLSAGVHYHFFHKILLFLYPFTLLCFIVTFVVLVFMKYMLYIVLSVFFTRYLVQFLAFFKISDKIGDRDILLFLPFLEIVHFSIQPLFMLSNLISRKNKWK